MTPNDNDDVDLHMHNFHDSNWEERGDNLSIPDILERIAKVAEDHWYSPFLCNALSVKPCK